MMNVCQNHFEKLVGNDGAPVGKPEEGVVREYSGDAHGARVHDSLVTERTKRPVAMHKRNALTQEDLT